MVCKFCICCLFRVQTLAHSVADKQNKKISFIIEDRVMVGKGSTMKGGIVFMSHLLCSYMVGKGSTMEGGIVFMSHIM